MAVGLYELHVWMLVELVREMFRVHDDLYGAVEELVPMIQRWIRLTDVLLEAGHTPEERS